MSKNDDEDRILSEVEKIARMAMGSFSVEEYETMLFGIGHTLTIWRSAMKAGGYSEYFIEMSAWLMMTMFYGGHLTDKTIQFQPPHKDAGQTP